jgi:protein-tyrosine-phosphatase
MAQVLVVCTGNICRSPMAEGFLRGLFRQRNQHITVASAGTSGWDGSPPTPEAIQAAAERDTDIGDHRARRVRPHHAEQADLVLCMTTEQRERVVQLAPTVAPRAFTIKELVQLLEALPAPADDDDEATENEATQSATTHGEPTDGAAAHPHSATTHGDATVGGAAAAEAVDRLRARVAEADALRVDGFESNRHDLDVADPIGMSIDTYRAVAWELDGLCTRLVDLLLGAPSATPASAHLAAMWKDGE